MFELRPDNPENSASEHTPNAERRCAREFSVGQFVFRDPQIYDFYDVVAEAILETQNDGVPPIKVRVRSQREGSLVRVRLNGIANARCKLSPWHWCATKFTKAEPNVVYAWIGEIATPAQFLVRYRLFRANDVMRMMAEPKISVKRLPAQRQHSRPALELEGLDDE